MDQVMGGRQFHICGACHEELFDDIPCHICNHPYVLELKRRIRDEEEVMSTSGSIASSVVNICPRCNETYVMDGEKHKCPTLTTQPDGGGLRMKYFVLKPRGVGPHAKASRQAMFSYAVSIRGEDPLLSQELLDWIRMEDDRARRDEEIKGEPR